jgi:hypothetical protein
VISIVVNKELVVIFIGVGDVQLISICARKIDTRMAD